MADYPQPVFRTLQDVSVTGVMAVYGSQAEASHSIPFQWQAFLRQNPGLANNPNLYGASPCTSDRKIHYLVGVAHETPGSVLGGEQLTLEAGEYGVFQVDDAASLRDTWVWLFSNWLPTSGRRERNAPEFERYTRISEKGMPIGTVEIWIPLKPHVES